MKQQAPKFRRSLLAHSVLIACGASAAVLTMQPALAQTAATLNRVEVTGSNIPRSDKETPSPVQVITAEDLKNSGYTTVNEVLQNLTSNGSGTLSKGFSGAFSAGASGISLRGLTLGATLILIDGHRMAPYPLADDAQRSFVDISSIPFSAVERIEVLKDGASAVYGSDAMAGVVNVILKKRIEGTSVTAEAGNTEKGGGATRSITLAHGFGNSESTSRGYVALEARHGDAVKLSQRSGDWNKFDWRSEGGLDLRPGARNIVATAPRVNSPILQIPGSATTSAANFAFYPGCNYTAWRASECIYANTWAQLQPETDNLNLLARFDTRISSDWDLQLTGSRFQSKTKTAAAQAAFPNGTFVGVTAIGPNRTPAIVGANPNFRVPANYPGNTLGVAANIRGGFAEGFNQRNDIDTIATRFAAELTGNLADWDVNAALGYTKVETTQTYNGYVHFANLYTALTRANNPYLLGGGNSAEVLSFVSPSVSNTGTSTLNFFDARASRELTQLAGGPLGISTGFSYSTRDLSAPSTIQRQNGEMNLPSAYAFGVEKNTAVYVEMVAPVTKSLELDAAVRFDKFDSYGNSTTPKVAFKFTPVKEVTLRGTASRGFRAPGAAENGNAASTFSFNAIRDPQLCSVLDADGTPDTTAAANVPVFCNFNPIYLQNTTKDLEPEKSTSYTLGLIFEPVQNWSTTLDFYRVEIDGQIVPEAALSTYDPLKYAVRGTPQNVTFGDGRTGLSPVGTIQYSTTGYVNGQKTSTSGMEFETRYKFLLEDKATFTVGLQLSRMFDYKQTINGITAELAGTHGPSIIGGNTANPQNRGQITLNYAKGPWTIASTTNYVGEYNMTDPSLGINDCLSGINANNAQFANHFEPAGGKYCKAGAFHTTNLSVKYQFNKGLTLRGAIVNLFGAEPPVDLNTYGGTGNNGSSAGSGAPYNPSLHQVGAIGRSMSVAVDYKF